MNTKPNDGGPANAMKLLALFTLGAVSMLAVIAFVELTLLFGFWAYDHMSKPMLALILCVVAGVAVAITFRKK